MNGYDFYDDELKKKEEEEARNKRQVQQPPYGDAGFNGTPGGNYYYSQPGEMPPLDGPGYNGNYAGYSAPPIPPQTSKSNKTLWIVLGCVLLVVIFFVGYVVGHSIVGSDLSILDTVLETVKKDSLYYDESNWDAIKRQMIVNGGTAMLQTIDGYGFLLSPAEYYTLLNPEATTSASYGMRYVRIEIGLYVSSVEYGSGAFLAGLTEGDVIISVVNNGVTYDMRTCTEAEMYAAFEGDWGSSCTLNLIRGLYTVEYGDELSVERLVMTKHSFGGQFVEYYFGDGKTNLSADVIASLGLSELNSATTGYIRINSFENSRYFDGTKYVDTNAAKEFGEAMGKFRDAYSGRGKLVLDLVDNPGGNVDYAKEIAGYLCYNKENPSNKKLLVTTLKGRKGVLATYSTNSVYSDYFDTAATSPQITVLTNEMSASASELLLGAMLDYGTGVQIGTTTYGKGIAQSAESLNYFENIVTSEGTQRFPYGIYYTAAKFYTPKNVNKHGIGFTPETANRADSYTEMLRRSAALLG